nr:MAG TPA: hypothetical protein [Caudoviricetes sp.]
MRALSKIRLKRYLKIVNNRVADFCCRLANFHILKFIEIIFIHTYTSMNFDIS